MYKDVETTVPSGFVGWQGSQCSRVDVNTDHLEPCRPWKDLAFFLK